VLSSRIYVIRAERVNKLAAAGNVAINIVQQPWFIKYIKVVDPKFATRARKKAGSMIHASYVSKYGALLNFRAVFDAVSLTYGIWSDRRIQSFSVITVHLLTPDMQFNSYCTRCIKMEVLQAKIPQNIVSS
jgi:hypothetical protein